MSAAFLLFPTIYNVCTYLGFADTSRCGVGTTRSTAPFLASSLENATIVAKRVTCPRTALITAPWSAAAAKRKATCRESALCQSSVPAAARVIMSQSAPFLWSVVFAARRAILPRNALPHLLVFAVTAKRKVRVIFRSDLTTIYLSQLRTYICFYANSRCFYRP